MNIHSVIEQIENRLKEENIDMDFTKLITIQEMYMYEEFGVDIVERVVELCRSEKLEQEKLITRILEAKDTKNELLGKDDIIRIFKCENEKALKILRVAFDMRYATKIGKEYYIEKTKLEEFMNDVRGRKVVL